MKPIRLIQITPGLLVAATVTAAPESQPLADGLTRTLVAREPLLKNPVVVSVDVDGAVYVAETARRLAADLDIREFKQWIPQTLALTSVEDRLALYRRELVLGKTWPKTSLKDRNGDGVVDIKDLTVISEKIHRLTDTDGDGVMDKSAVFAEGFNTEVTGIAAGVMAWRGDVYASIIPDLWKLRDTTGKGVADKREKLLAGFGVHVAYAGHDMHGLVLGPDGKIYWTIGDKGVNVVSKDGKRWSAPHEGSVLRCNPDGTGFEIFARGLRNVQQIAFDDYGNIFGVDNDSDAKGEKERFVYIAEDSDTGWRCYYQYRGSDYNPWMAESISVPAGKDQPAYIIPPLCSYMDGPSGFARDPGTALNERHRGAFFMTGFPAGLLYAFKTEPQGAGFRMTDSHVVDKGPAYVGCNFGPDGALYLADWAGGYPLKEKGAVWKIDDPKAKDSPIRREVAGLLKAGPGKVSDAELVKRLKHPDQRVRSDAHLELAKRPTGVAMLQKAASAWKEEPLACTHALWGLTQAKLFSQPLLTELLAAKAEHTREQAAKWAGETAGRPVPELVPLLKDSSAMVRYRAAVAIGKLGMTGAADAVIAMLAENANRDHYLRHAGVLALAGMKPEAVAKAAQHSSPAVRLAAAVVYRRLGSQEVAALLADKDPAVAGEAAHAIYDDASIKAALPALAELLEKNPKAPAPAIRRAIATNRVMADEASAVRLVKLAADAAQPVELRIAALSALGSWGVKLELDPVDGRWHPGPAADAAVARKAFSAVAAKLEHDTNADLAKAAAAASKALGVVSDPARLAGDAADAKLSADIRLQALAGLKTGNPAEFARLAASFLAEKDAGLRIGAADLMESGPAVTAYALAAVRDSKSLPERQHAIALLGRSTDPKAAETLAAMLAKAEDAPELQLDLLDAATAPGPKGAADELRARLAKKGEIGAFLPSLAGGDAARGKDIYEAHLAAQCTACHRVGKEGSNVGPPLTEVGKKGRDYILESLVLPQAKIAPGYGAMTVTKKDGTVLAGAPKSESAQAVVMLMPEGKELSIPAADIASKTDAISPMPPMGAILKPGELRDLVEYLSSLK
ncbi:c-type cytochrome [Luteolibacter ambystomatis]|uniref:C-type cytochrome n=1 Tax=Luteolibacter ambystomatis TaxID=2824561 RepID=A0A975J2T0_9BACT|nr:HEAT repeat domain-containing protein [Luteolibacter ambystomatis]QUE53002.1 c-type cytochrome [Luteolibacter ambystomatis]